MPPRVNRKVNGASGLLHRANGIGLAGETPASSEGGLAAVRELSQTYNGFYQVAGARNAGTTVTVSLPIA